jgi:hypothetical protein
MEDARQKKRENDLREGQLVEAARIGQDVDAAGQLFRQHAEAITKAHGREVGEAIRDMLDEAERAWQASVRERTDEAAREAKAAEVAEEAKSARPRSVKPKKRRKRKRKAKAQRNAIRTPHWERRRKRRAPSIIASLARPLIRGICSWRPRPTTESRSRSSGHS